MNFQGSQKISRLLGDIVMLMTQAFVVNAQEFGTRSRSRLYSARAVFTLRQWSRSALLILLFETSSQRQGVHLVRPSGKDHAFDSRCVRLSHCPFLCPSGLCFFSPLPFCLSLPTRLVPLPLPWCIAPMFMGAEVSDFCCVDCKHETFDLVWIGFIHFQAESVEMQMQMHLLRCQLHQNC